MTCYVEKCEKDDIAKGLCTTHYQRMRRNGTLEVKILIDKNPAGRVCTKCDEHKPWTEFYKRKKGYFSECKPCYKVGQYAKAAARRGQEGA